jgi:DNA replication protein DnaC
MNIPQWVRRNPPPDFLRFFNVPKGKWEAQISKIKDGLPYLTEVALYLNDLKQNLETGKGLLLCGPYRSGKSCLAALAVREAGTHGCHPFWLEAFELVDGWISKDYRYREARTCHLLVIDDLGTEAQEGDKREFPREIVRQVLRYRLEREMAVIVTTNMMPDELRETYGEKLMALLNEYLVPIPVAGMNWTKEA